MDELKHPQSEQHGRPYVADRGRLRGTDNQRPVYRSPVDTKKPVDVVVPKNASKVTRMVSKTKPAMPRPHKSLVLKRHISERADAQRKQHRTERKRHFANGLIVLVIVAALGVVSWAFWDFLPVIRSISIPFVNTSNTKKPDPITMKTKSTLDENKPSPGELEVYQAAPDAPRILRIPKLEVEARVKRVGTSLNGEPISPSNIFDVGWYDESAKPGQLGAMFINGHATGSTKNGIFHDLNMLQVGDDIQVERGDHSVITYIINKVQTYSGDQVDMDTVLQPIVQNKNGLNLVTSTANYDGVMSTSEKRVIVFALQK